MLDRLLDRLPDVLVLAGGGVLGEAWMQGLLAGVEDARGLDFRATRAFVGTSAGSIVAATLAAGERPRRPGEPPAHVEQAGAEARRPAPARGLLSALAAPLAPVALAVSAPGGAALRAAALSRAGPGSDELAGLRRHVQQASVRFDGRLRVTAVDRASGRRVVFGAPGAPEATVAEAVQASCTIPGVFTPVRIGDREYVDGGAWSPTNLDVAPAERGDVVLCLHPLRGLDLPLRSPMGMLRALGGAGTALELAALRRRGARVRVIGPDLAAAELMSANLMDRRRAPATLEAGYRQGRALT